MFTKYFLSKYYLFRVKHIQYLVYAREIPMNGEHYYNQQSFSGSDQDDNWSCTTGFCIYIV